jgi:hypothetical protein
VPRPATEARGTEDAGGAPAGQAGTGGQAAVDRGSAVTYWGPTPPKLGVRVPFLGSDLTFGDIKAHFWAICEVYSYFTRFINLFVCAYISIFFFEANISCMS